MYRRNAASRPSPKSFVLYKTFIVMAIYGMLRESDALMRQHGTAIRRVARYLHGQLPIIPKTLYRGMLIPAQEVTDSIARPVGVTFVSFSEDLQVACWFATADTTMAEVVLAKKPGAVGWIGSYEPNKDQILFHHTWMESLTEGPGPNIYEIAVKAFGNEAAMQFYYHAKHQQEVIIESNIEYPIQRVENFACEDARELDNRFIPHGDFVNAPPGLQEFGIAPGMRLNISKVIHHRPLRTCYQCGESAVKTTYILEAPLVVDICANCLYIYRNPINGARY